MVVVGVMRFHIVYSHTYLDDVIHSYYTVHCSSVCDAVFAENVIYFERCRQLQFPYRITSRIDLA